MTEFNSKIKKNSRILKIFMFSICALFACAISSHAQSLVKGTVTDGIGEPLPGVSVVVKGTTNGTITDVNGKYYNRQIKKFPTEKQNVSLKHILT